MTMSLDFEFKGIRDWEMLKRDNGEWNAMTQSIVSMMPVIRMTRIDEENWKEVTLRLALLQKLFGPCGPTIVPLDKSQLPYQLEIGANIVRRHIGLKCNVIHESRHKFSKSLVEAFWYEKGRELFGKDGE